jgi:probable phosphoglycerate mutase
VELLLIRHALPRRIELAEGRADPPLSEAGARQAEVLAEWLVEEGVDAVFTSPLQRAVQTAEPLVDRIGVGPVVVDGLAEWDREANAYIPIEELKAEDDPRWKLLVGGGDMEELGIDPVEFQRSVVEAVEGVIAESPSMRVAAVCHGGVINAYLSHVLRLDRMMFFEPGYTSISRVHASRAGHRSVGSVNELGHLRGLG